MRLKTALAILFSMVAATFAQSQEAPSKVWHEGLQVSREDGTGIPNASHFGEAIYFGGQPTAEELMRLAGQGIKTVINLRTAPEMDQLDFDEAKTVQDAGMRYIHIPIDGRNLPGSDVFEQIEALLDDAQSHPVLLHCASSNRVGFVWAMFRADRHGLDAESAAEEGRAAGMRSPRLEAFFFDQRKK